MRLTREGKDMRDNNVKQLGAVSLFVVIFATLLMTIVTVSFIRLMIAEQQRASTVDLSQSAYDSAQAGVEDAKRAVLKYETICTASAATEADIVESTVAPADPTVNPAYVNAKNACDAAAGVINSPGCNVAVEKSDGDASPDGHEVVIEKTSDNATDQLYDQAYTCVKIDLNTADYLGVLPANSSELIPLRGVTGIDTVTIEWYNKDDTGTANGVSFRTVGVTNPLLPNTSWQLTDPSVLRAQFMQVGSSFSLSDLDNPPNNTASDANTLFLYPVRSPTNDVNSYSSTNLSSSDARVLPEPAKSSVQTNCVADRLATGSYACKMVITLPNPIGSTADVRTAYLQLGAFYNATHYRITLSENNNGDPTKNGPVSFAGVQPNVDSTGRATDLFRRVQSRIKLGADFPYPTAAVGVSGNFCKNFVVTDDTGQFATLNNSNLADCNPDSN